MDIHDDIHSLKKKLRYFSEAYFSFPPTDKDSIGDAGRDSGETDEEGSDFPAFFSDFAALTPRDRVAAMIKLMKFMIPEMKSSDMKIRPDNGPTPLRLRLASLLNAPEGKIPDSPAPYHPIVQPIAASQEEAR